MTYRKVLCLCALLILAAALACAACAEEMARDVTDKCRYSVSSGKKHYLTNGNVRACWYYDSIPATMTVELPEGQTGGGMVIEWLREPFDYLVTEYDGTGNVIRTRDASDFLAAVYVYYEFLPETVKVEVKINKKNQTICEVHVCTPGTLSDRIELWDPPVEKADIMLLVAHDDDEELFFGGLIPYYSLVRKKNVIVTYMTQSGRKRKREALDGLWSMGYHTYPEFIDLDDDRVAGLQKNIDAWGGKKNILKVLVEEIRKYKPEVIVTHDFNGEYGHAQHKLLAAATKYAIDAAADASQFPESAQQYGAWQVKKQYNHLYAENAIQMDWDTPAAELGGKTPFEVAEIGYSRHQTQQLDYQMEHHGQYDNSKFGLYFTLVGDDVLKNDFLENIPDSVTASEAQTEENAETGEDPFNP